MNSRLIVSVDKQALLQEIQKILDENKIKLPHPDLLYFDENQKLGVQAAKKIREHLSLKPYNATAKIVIIEASQNLTVDGQNALLKTLEEPAQNSQIVLGATSLGNFLPTILSRCEIINLTIPGNADQYQTTRTKFEKDIERLIAANIPEKFSYIEKLEEKEEFLDALMIIFRSKLASKPNSENLKIAKLVLQAKNWQKSNINIRAILEYLMLEIGEDE